MGESAARDGVSITKIGSLFRADIAGKVVESLTVFGDVACLNFTDGSSISFTMPSDGAQISYTAAITFS